MENQKRSEAGMSDYINPVYPKSFPDPFVLKFCGSYYAYATGHAPDGNLFQILRSKDLVTWEEVGSAMKPLEGGHPFYWAPEVFYANGSFYLYYSVGNETLMHLRVAVSDRPDGGFVDSGKQLTNQDFAIDAHVFVDTDGSKYLFYATDFLDHSHIGTGTVVDRMLDWFTLEGRPSVVTRAKFDWQVYDPNRIEKGGVRWHTVEGPAVLKRKGVYYEMFSGGNWQNTTYGVSFAKSTSVISPDEWEQFADGERLLPILRTLPGRVVGPGHNSIVRGPNNRELFTVYHRWTDEGRVMAIDRVDFAGERLFVVGATTTTQPSPFLPNAHTIDLLSRGGEWKRDVEKIVSQTEGGTLECQVPDAFLCELNVKLNSPVKGEIGIRLTNGHSFLELSLGAGENGTSCRLSLNGRIETVFLPVDFDVGAYHLIRIDRDQAEIRVDVDGIEMVHEATMKAGPAAMQIYAIGGTGTVSGFSLTEGFENTFELGEIGSWKCSADHTQAKNQELIIEAANEPETISRQLTFEDLEFAASIRLEKSDDEWSFWIEFADKEKALTRLSVDWGRPRVNIQGKPAEEFLALQDLFDWSRYHQFRLIKYGEMALFYIDDLTIGTFRMDGQPTIVILGSVNSRIAVDEIRLTKI